MTDEILKECFDISEHHKCQNTFGSYSCVYQEKECGEGYVLDEENNQCVDVDECQMVGSEICLMDYSGVLYNDFFA